MDMACGTGEIAIPLHGEFSRVLASDIEPGMIEVGRDKAAAVGASNIEWRVGRAEDVVVSAADDVRLVTLGNAFHWVDRVAVAGRALEWLEPGGCIAILGSSTPWSGSEPWQAVVVECLEHWATAVAEVSPAAPGGSGDAAAQRVTHDEVLRDVGFGEVAQYEFPTPHTWTVDELLGFLWSTSRTGRLRQHPAIARRFEADLRDRLRVYDESGQLRESVAHYYILGRRP
ncbi:ubiquinone/menaquinone biosynthesis methyltransferase [Nocardia otitidiscaviarum]|uniref:Ubiquinone/menaquinone biosynthesis methyltransferase n=1 Tax=Nocardia otitidiscaviarum TaxID=1823 RepID=A0A379JMZ7_9NOCA|nr:ubiquinone/menaquinone biosynthesis methyltransferase [Nocardia otitidiscaviarum]